MEEQRSVLEISPESLYNIWNQWQLKVMVLLSLSLQIMLIMFGNLRNRTTSNWVKVLVWMMYLSADSVATISLGILSSIEEDAGSSIVKSADPHNLLAAVWASFLLLHLGGPDTITAYSLEDNELRLRHFLGLVVQVGVAIYVLFKSRIHTHRDLMFLAVPIFMSGIIKYGERTWALRSASKAHFTTGLYLAPNLGDHSKYAANPNTWSFTLRNRCVKGELSMSGSLYLSEAFTLYENLRDIYGNIELNYVDKQKNNNILSGKSREDAFRIVDVELGFLFDVLYTKAPVIWYHLRGFLLRVITFVSSIFGLVMFSRITDKKAYSNIDITITYLFLVGAIFLETYSIILLITSDWAILLLSKADNRLADFFYVILYRCCFSENEHKMRWSGSMGQCNLIDFAIKERSTISDAVLRIFGIYEAFMKQQYTSWENVSVELKELIYQQLGENCHRARVEHNDINRVLGWRGDEVLRKNKCFDKFDWSIGPEVGFDHSLLIWHIATDLCYNSDLKKCQGASNIPALCKVSKSLSDYMLYLLFINPSMLRSGEAKFLETWSDIKIYIGEHKESIQGGDGREGYTSFLLGVGEERFTCPTLGEGSKLARLLQSLETEEEQRWSIEQKWEMINQVWVEMLCYAACHCELNDHAKQLRQGGELLTHVSVLMAHLCI